MQKKNVLIILLVLIGLYLAYYFLSSKIQSDEDGIKNIISGFTTSFAEKNLRAIQNSITEDFVLMRYGRIVNREKLSDMLRIIFIRGNSIILSGTIDELKVTGDAAKVVWTGTINVRGKSLDRSESGTGLLDFAKIDGKWLLKRARLKEGSN